MKSTFHPRPLAILSPLLMSLIWQPAVAQTDDAAIEQVLVTGSYAPLSAAAQTATVTVIDAAQVRAQNKRTLAQLLTTVPGIAVEQQGGPGGLTAVSIRGGEANFTVVMLDGIPLNDPTNTFGGSVDLQNFDTTMVERIEIVRGPQSAVYGSDALAGVINIITRRGSESLQGRLWAEGGQDDYANLSAGMSGRKGGLDFAVNIARRDDGQAVEGSSRDIEDININGGWRIGDAHALRLTYRSLEGDRSSFPEQSGGPEYAASRERDRSEFSNDSLGLSWVYQMSNIWRSALSASRFELEDDYQSPGIYPFFAVPPQTQQTEFERDQYQWVNTLSPHRNLAVNLGVDLRRERGDSVGTLDFGFALLPTDFSLDRKIHGYFVEATAHIERLTLQGSLRYDDPDSFDGETTARLGLKYSPAQRVELTANWGQGFKLPSFFALGHGLVGNPELQPETGDSLDLGVHWQATGTLALSAVWFANDYRDLIDFDSALFTNVNRKQVETSGVELEAHWQPLAALRLQAQATYTDLDLDADTGVLQGRPESKAGVTAFWQLWQRWDTVLDYQWTGEQYASSLYTGDTVVQTLDDFHRVDWRLRWQALETLRLELAVDNLLDQDYQTAVGFPAPGRSVRVGLELANW